MKNNMMYSEKNNTSRFKKIENMRQVIYHYHSTHEYLSTS